MLDAVGFLRTDQKIFIPCKQCYPHLDKKHELSAFNTESKTLSFILFLYTLEFGEPPFYAAINKAMRELDYSTFDTLGPYIRILTNITQTWEVEKKYGATFLPGCQIGNQKSNLGGSYIVFRGAQFTPELLKEWEDKVLMCRIRLSTYTSGSFSLRMAL